MMAGRGRGRGRSLMSFSVEAVGINRGDGLPPSSQQPTPLFPLMEQKPLPLTGGEEAEYLLALKQEFRGAMRSLPGYIQRTAAGRDVERYSDKYHSSEQTEGQPRWTADWKRFPKELQVHAKKPNTPRASAAVSHSNGAQSAQKKIIKEKQEVLLKLETLEKREEQGSSGEEDEEGGGEKKKKQEDEEVEGEEEYDEEEFEEGTDYIMSYFDNGEDFGEESDDNMDEAVY